MTSKCLSSSGLLLKVVVEKNGALMVVNSEHPSNAEIDMALRFGITIEVSNVQLWNARSPIVVTGFRITIEVRDEQLQSIVQPIVVTEFGVTIKVRDVQY